MAYGITYNPMDPNDIQVIMNLSTIGDGDAYHFVISAYPTDQNQDDPTRITVDAQSADSGFPLLRPRRFWDGLVKKF